MLKQSRTLFSKNLAVYTILWKRLWRRVQRPWSRRDSQMNGSRLLEKSPRRRSHSRGLKFEELSPSPPTNLAGVRVFDRQCSGRRRAAGLEGGKFRSIQTARLKIG